MASSVIISKEHEYTLARVRECLDEVDILEEARDKILEAIWDDDLQYVLDKRMLQWVEDSMDISYEIEDSVNDVYSIKKEVEDFVINDVNSIKKRRQKKRQIKLRKLINEQKMKIKEFNDRIGKMYRDLLDIQELRSNTQHPEPNYAPSVYDRNMDGLMSYNRLSLGMKRCFLYFAAFPSDFQIEVSSLLRIWVAERLIPYVPKSVEVPDPSLEKTAQGCLREFSRRNMVQFLGGPIKYCWIPDVLRALAIEKSKEINFLMVCTMPDDWHIYDEAYRVAVHYSNDNELTDNYGGPNVRSLLLFGKSSKVDCSKYGMLRVLANMRGEVKLESFRGSSHLRYLQLNTAFNDRDFGEWVGGMTNLETLDLRLSMHGDLSNWIWRAKTLRHVLLSEYYGETQGPPVSADLTNLQTLTGVYWNKSGETSSYIIFFTNKMQKLEELGIFIYGEPETEDKIIMVDEEIWDLRRDLRLKIQGVIDLKKIAIPEFRYYWKLKSLVLINDDYNSDYTLVLDDNILMLPKGLTELELGFQFGSDPMPVLEKLERLNTLRIRGGRDIRKNTLTSIRCSCGGFKQLEELVLESLGLKEWKIERGAMPRLQRLSIRLCPLLRMPSELMHLGNLQHLTCTVIKTSLYFANRDEIRNIFEQRPNLQGGLQEEFGDFIPFDSF